MAIKKKIVIGIPVLLHGGTELQTLQLVHALMPLADGIAICCYHEHDRSMVEAYRASGADVHLLGLPRVRSIWAMNRFVKMLSNTFASLLPELIHLQYITPGFLAVQAARRSGCRKIIASIHYPSTTLGVWEKMLFRAGTARCDCVIANSLATEQSWFDNAALFDPGAAFFTRHHVTIYNCIDSSRIDVLLNVSDRSAVRNTLRVDDDIVLSVIGRLSPEKGHEVLFKALHRMNRKGKKATVLIIGGGGAEDSLRKLADELQISSQLRWYGTVDQEEVIRLQQASDIAVIPSLIEGFGLAAAEAMAAGLPVVASLTGGLPEVIEDGRTGLLVAPGDAEALAEAILLLADNPEMRATYGKAGRRRVKALFSVERYQASVRAVYDLLTKGRTDT